MRNESSDLGLKKYKKSTSLGIFSTGPMQCTVLDLHGLNPKDATDILQKKIYRALRSGAKQIKVIHGPSAKLKRKVEEFLSQLDTVTQYESDDDSGVILVSLMSDI